MIIALTCEQVEGDEDCTIVLKYNVHELVAAYEMVFEIIWLMTLLVKEKTSKTS